MGQLEDMAMFIRVVDAGSITNAADQLNIAKSAVSRRLKELENRLNTQLISRTTRNSTLTEAGQKYYQEACSILSEVDLLNEQISGLSSHLEGKMRLTAPLSFGLMHLDEIIHNFAQQHPQLCFELDFSDRHIDLVEEGYELAIRIGELKDSSYQAKRLTVIRRVLCASPEYIKQAGMPDSIEALKQHNFLQYGLTGRQGEVEVIDPAGKRHKVEMASRFKANNGNFLVDMAIKGHGIVFTPTFIAYQSLAKGELIRVMEDHQFPTLNAYAVYPKNRFLSQRCRLLIDYIIEQIGDEPYWDNI
jgi:DNA-binding transcriptional LysR family regulator